VVRRAALLSLLLGAKIGLGLGLRLRVKVKVEG
jgi:hypothetical protein